VHLLIGCTAEAGLCGGSIADRASGPRHIRRLLADGKQVKIICSQEGFRHSARDYASLILSVSTCARSEARCVNADAMPAKVIHLFGEAARYLHAVYRSSSR